MSGRSAESSEESMARALWQKQGWPVVPDPRHWECTPATSEGSTLDRCENIHTSSFIAYWPKSDTHRRSLSAVSMLLMYLGRNCHWRCLREMKNGVTLQKAWDEKTASQILAIRSHNHQYHRYGLRPSRCHPKD